MLAIVHALKKWKHYLLGAKIKVYTDNVALKFWRTAQNLSPLQVMWQANISMFDVEISHITGVTNTAADAISRLECRIADTSSLEAAYIEDTRFQARFQDGHPLEFRHGRLWKDDHIEVPRSKLRDTMEFRHSNTAHGHCGLRKTYELIARKFVFKNMKSLIAEFIQTCPECQRSKADRR